MNSAKGAKVATNQRDGQMAYGVDLAPGQNPSVNYEPSILGGLREAEYPTHDEQGPEITGRLTRKRIPRTNDYAQAGERYLLSEQWERDDLVANLTGALAQCDRPIQERMVWHLLMCEDEPGPARRRRPRHQRRRRAAPRAARHPDAQRARACSAWRTSARTALATSRAWS
nr:catalase-related domain-containing protein [Angustibacter aerolatus]